MSDEKKTLLFFETVHETFCTPSGMLIPAVKLKVYGLFPELPLSTCNVEKRCNMLLLNVTFTVCFVTSFSVKFIVTVNFWPGYTVGICAVAPAMVTVCKLVGFEKLN